VASGSIDRTVGLWDLHARPGKHPLHLLRGHTNAVRAVAYAPDEAILASTGYDHTLRLWDVRSGRLLDTLPTNGTTALSVAFDQCGEWLALGAQEQ
jgi:WD40 repeat protein